MFIARGLVAFLLFLVVTPVIADESVTQLVGIKSINSLGGALEFASHYNSNKEELQKSLAELEKSETLAFKKMKKARVNVNLTRPAKLPVKGRGNFVFRSFNLKRRALAQQAQKLRAITSLRSELDVEGVLSANCLMMMSNELARKNGELKIGESGQIPNRKITVVQVVDKNSFHGYCPSLNKRLIIHGISTEGLVDDQEINIPQIFKVSGTRTYSTVLNGTNTVFELDRIDLETIRTKIAGPNSVRRD